MYVNLNGKRKNCLLPFVDSEQLENIIIKGIKSNVELQQTQNKQKDYYRSLVKEALSLNLVK